MFKGSLKVLFIVTNMYLVPRTATNDPFYLAESPIVSWFFLKGHPRRELIIYLSKDDSTGPAALTAGGTSDAARHGLPTSYVALSAFSVYVITCATVGRRGGIVDLQVDALGRHKNAGITERSEPEFVNLLRSPGIDP